MHYFLAEFLGTLLLILLGNGVVANVSLNKSKAQGGGFLMVAFGWAIAVFVGVYLSAPFSGAHLNPAITLSMYILGKITLIQMPMYMFAQLLGAMAGALLNWVMFRQHFNATQDSDVQLGVFATMPAIYSPVNNLISEAIGTFVLVIGVLFIVAPASSLGALDALPVALLVLGIGVSLGGPTGYAINPARDLGPRMMHQLLPIKGKGSSGWHYSWVPVLGPFLGALLAVWVFHLVQ
ncbi:MAG: MIP/aquaporin family protein [Chitinophagaceae bacterium]